jgi:hypothetical protein
MPTLAERVDRLEVMFASFMERSEQSFAEMRAFTAEIRSGIADISASNARTDAILVRMHQQAEKDRQQAEKDRRDFNKRLAEISDSMGTLIEDMVCPNAPRIAAQLFPSDPIITSGPRLKRRHPEDLGRSIELDYLSAGRHNLMVVEAKRRIDAEKVREFLERLQLIPEFFPEYNQHRIYPVIASVHIDPSVITFLNRQKVYGLAMGDETMELVNFGQF